MCLFVSRFSLIYGYECRQSKCIKVELEEDNWYRAISLPVCRMFCGDAVGTIWPKPTSKVELDSTLLHIDRSAIEFLLPLYRQQEELWEQNRERFMDFIESKVPNPEFLKNKGYPLKIVIEMLDYVDIDEKPRLTLDTDESYQLKIETSDEHEVLAKITAKTYFGARHGLETLNQLIVYDDIRRELQIVSKAFIDDAPAYKWRGLLLDTSRNYYSTKAIKRTLGKLVQPANFQCCLMCFINSRSKKMQWRW